MSVTMTRARRPLSVADDGIATRKGARPRAWLEVPEPVLLYTMSGERQDAFADTIAAALTPTPGYDVQVTVLSTPLTAAATVADVFAGLCPPTAALTDLKERLAAGWTAYLSGRYVPHMRCLIAVTGPAKERRDTSLNLVVDEIQRGLRRAGVGSRRLGGAAVRALLDAYPDDPPPDETLDEARGVDAAGRSYWARSFYILIPPRRTNPGWLAVVLAFPAPLRLTLHITARDQEAERTRTKRRGRYLGDVVGARGRYVDPDAVDARDEATGQARRMRSAGAAVVTCGIYVTVFAPDRDSLRTRATALWGLLTSSGGIGAKAARAPGHQKPLALATRPLGQDPARSAYKMEAETVGNAWPFVGHTPGHAGGPPIGVSAIDGSLVRLNLRDRSLKNKLISTFGGSGQGKTFFVQLLMLWFVLADAWVTAIDTVGGYEALVDVAGGRMIRLGGPGTAAINIWDGPRATEEDLAARTRFVVRAHDVLLSASGRPLDDLAHAAIAAGVRAVYAGFRAPDASADDGRPSDGAPLERDLVAWLEEQARAQEDHEDRRLYKTLAARLAAYVRRGEHAALMDRPTSFRIDTHLLAVQIDRKDLAPGTPVYAFVMFALTDLVDRRHARAKAWYAAQRRGTVEHFLAWDEGWALLKHPAGQDWVSDTGLTGRHDAMIPNFISQKISHLAKGAAADFFDQASLHFIFNMHDTNDESGVDPRKWVAGKLRLTEAEGARVDTLQGEEGKHSQMLMIRTSKYGPPARGVVNVPATIKEVYWLFASDPDDKDLRRAMVRAVARDPNHPTGDEVWRAVCLLAAGQTPEGVTSARTVDAVSADTVAAVEEVA